MLRLYLVGMPGSGKTKIGRSLSKRIDLPFADLDDYLVSKEGRDINTIFSESGESYFRELERDCLRALTKQSTSFVLATGGGAPCFFDNMEYMNGHGITLFLNPPIWQIATRMMHRSGNQKRPLLKDLEDKVLLSELEEKLKIRLPYYLQSAFEVDLGLDFFEQRVQRIIELVEF